MRWQVPIVNWPQWLFSQVLLAIALITLFAAWRFRRTDVVFLTLIISVMSLALLYVKETESLTPGRLTILRNATWVMGHLNLAIFSSIRDRGLFSLHGLLRMTFIIGQALLFFAWSIGITWVPAPIDNPAVRLAFSSHTVPFIVTALVVLLLLFHYFHNRNRVSGAASWTTVLSACAFSQPDPKTAALLMMAGVCSLFLGVLEHLLQVAYEDELTGLPGRRALNRALTLLHHPYAIAMVDVDHFKRFNDRYGHDVGDEVLRKVASRLMRPGKGGQPFRAGGEEFVLVFPGCQSRDIWDTVESVRKSIREKAFHFRNSGKRRRSSATERSRTASGKKGVRITISIGIADSTQQRNAQHVLKLADKALYRAKRGGRDRVSR